MKAHLYLDEETFLKAIVIEDGSNTIRIQSISGYVPMLLGMDNTQTLNLQTGVYRRWEPLHRPLFLQNFDDIKEWKFLFSHFETVQEHIPQDSFDIGFMEPTKDVNLDKLKNKMRDSKDLRNILLEYYRK